MHASSFRASFGALRSFYILWGTQALSQLGSAMTGFALTLWLYRETGSALQTALLSVCNYAPYVLASIFAGALSDRWDKKKTLLVCDTLAALSTATVGALLLAGRLAPWHMYVLNAFSGLMNTVQQPAGDVAMTLLVPKAHYQRTSGLRSLSSALVSLLNPLLATAVFALAGMGAVILIDLATFAAAFLALWLGVKLPRGERAGAAAPFGEMVKSGLRYLRATPLVLRLILFLAGVNLVASAFEAALPALVLPRPQGGERVLGYVSACAGLATLGGSVLCMLLPPPRDRVRVICWTMLVSLGTENFLLAFTRQPLWWCLGQLIGWALVPLMNANLDVVLRRTIPVDMQGRVYACRNALQFFTIPLGLTWGGAMVDGVLEPWMARQPVGSLPTALFGAGKGAGAAAMMCLLGLLGVAVCLVFSRALGKYRFREEEGGSAARPPEDGARSVR